MRICRWAKSGCAPSGSSGGHHGLESIEQHLASREFARLRIGIGRKDGAREITDYVLGKFDPAENALLEKVLDRAADQVECWLDAGIEKAMNQFNGVVDSTNEEEKIVKRYEGLFILNTVRQRRRRQRRPRQDFRGNRRRRRQGRDGAENGKESILRASRTRSTTPVFTRTSFSPARRRSSRSCRHKFALNEEVFRVLFTLSPEPKPAK